MELSKKGKDISLSIGIPVVGEMMTNRMLLILLCENSSRQRNDDKQDVVNIIM